MKLADVEVASPCRESWEQMTGDQQARHCRRCDKQVFNLSEMTTDDAEALLAAHGTSLCLRLYLRADGTVKTADCPAPRRWPVAAVGAAAIAAGALALGGRAEPRRLPLIAPPMVRPVAPPAAAVVPKYDVIVGPPAELSPERMARLHELMRKAEQRKREAARRLLENARGRWRQGEPKKKYNHSVDGPGHPIAGGQR